MSVVGVVLLDGNQGVEALITEWNMQIIDLDV